MTEGTLIHVAVLDWLLLGVACGVVIGLWIGWLVSKLSKGHTARWMDLSEEK